MHQALEKKTQCDKRKKTCILLLNAFIVIFRSYPNITNITNILILSFSPKSRKKTISTTVVGT